MIDETNWFIPHWNKKATLCPSSQDHVGQIWFEKLYLLLQIRRQNPQSSIISMGSSITENVNMMVINVMQEKQRTKNAALKNASISSIFLRRLTI